MSTPQSLPNAALLEKLLLGQLPPAEAEALCVQLQDSEQFAALAQSLIASDTLIEALHAQTTQPTPRPDARLEGLMARLSKLRPDLSGVTDDRTAAEGPVAGGVPITFLSPARQPDEMGRLGEYRVLKVLGQGGMGVVFLAEDVRLGRRVALKTMRPEAAQMANAKQRFLREARGTAAIEHDHIIPIFQVGEENGVPYLAMPLLRGEPLDERLKRAGGKPLPVREIVRIGREIAEGLAAAHEQGLIHRDIKPANVWLETPQGERGALAPCSRVKILDFGLARAAGENTNLTQSGAIVGTPAYMAPEQARGEAVDPRCDLFSLGCLLYQMCTGQKPFNGPDTMSILMSLALDQPAPPRQRNAELPAELSDLITRLLAKKPEDRPASARAVADGLAAIERGLSDVTMVQTASIVPAVAMPKPARSRRRLAVAVAAALLLTGGLIAAVVIIRDKHGKEVARFDVPDGGSVEVKPDDKGKPPENDKKQAVAIPADPLPKIEPGTPLGPLALVTNPAPLPGVRSWTIETRTPRSALNNTAVAYRPDGRILAIAGCDGAIRLLDSSTGQLVRVLVGHAERVYHLAWSPDGRTLAASIRAGTVRLWDADNGRHLRNLSGQTPEPMTTGFWLRDGRTLAASGGNRIFAWDVVSGQIVRDQTTLPNGSNLLTLSSDGKRLAGQVEGGKVRLWNAETAEEVKTLAGHAGGTFAVRYSPDGRLLATAGADNTVRLWQVETGKELWTWKGAVDPASSLAWSPDAKTLAVNRVVAPIIFLRVEDGKLLSSLPIPDTTYGMDWSPDSKNLAIGGGTGGVWVTTKAGQQAHVPGLPDRSYLTSLAWSPDSKSLAAATDAKGLYAVNATTGEVTASLAEATLMLAWSPSKWVASRGTDFRVLLWEPGGGKRLLHGHTSNITALAWSPDGKTLATGCHDDKTVRLWDGATGKLRKTLNIPPPYWPDSLTWSPDGRTLAVGDFDGQKSKVTFWNVDTGEQQGKPLADCNRVVWSPTADKVVSYRIPPELFSTKTGESLFKLSGDFYARAASWSPDGKFLATGYQGYEGQPGIQVWDAASGNEVRRLDRVCLDSLVAVPWSPDGKCIAAGGSQTIQLWDAATGKSEGVIFPKPHFHGLTIRPDGHYRGDAKVEDAIVMVVQKEDGSTETLPPAEFEQKYGWKNDPAKVRLIDK